MNETIRTRIDQAAEIILTSGATVRDCARRLGVSKTTIHKDMRIRLRQIDPERARAVGRILDFNRQQRHVRGGQATRVKYARLRAEKHKCR